MPAASAVRAAAQRRAERKKRAAAPFHPLLKVAAGVTVPLAGILLAQLGRQAAPYPETDNAFLGHSLDTNRDGISPVCLAQGCPREDLHCRLLPHRPRAGWLAACLPACLSACQLAAGVHWKGHPFGWRRFGSTRPLLRRKTCPSGMKGGRLGNVLSPFRRKRSPQERISGALFCWGLERMTSCGCPWPARL